jgi:hypothetical protein
MEIEAVQGMQSLLQTHHPKLIIEVHKDVSRNRLLDLIESLGYSRLAIPIEPVEGEEAPLFLDDRSYVFNVNS